MEDGKNVKDLTAGTTCHDMDGNELDVKTGEPKKEAKIVSAKDFIHDTSIGAKLEDMAKPLEQRAGYKDIPEEVEITHLKNLENGQIFEANDILMRRKDLVPCDEDGNKVHDNRRLGRFN
jgi:hypothetical protein